MPISKAKDKNIKVSLKYKVYILRILFNAQNIAKFPLVAKYFSLWPNSFQNNQFLAEFNFTGKLKMTKF